MLTNQAKADTIGEVKLTDRQTKGETMQQLLNKCRTQTSEILENVARVISDDLSAGRMLGDDAKAGRMSRAAAIEVLIERHGEQFGDDLLDDLGM